MFCIVELKHSAKNYFVVKTNCIKNYDTKSNNTKEYICFISPNKEESPNFQAEYKREYSGSPGLFKVFVLKTFASLTEAVSDLGKKRLHSVPKKFRDQGQSDKEVLKEQSKQRRMDTKQNKLKLDAAKKKNMEYFSESLNSELSTKNPSDAKSTVKDSKMLTSTAPTPVKRNHDGQGTKSADITPKKAKISTDSKSNSSSKKKKKPKVRDHLQPNKPAAESKRSQNETINDADGKFEHLSGPVHVKRVESNEISQELEENRDENLPTETVDRKHLAGPVHVKRVESNEISQELEENRDENLPTETVDDDNLSGPVHMKRVESNEISQELEANRDENLPLETVDRKHLAGPVHMKRVESNEISHADPLSYASIETEVLRGITEYAQPVVPLSEYEILLAENETLKAQLKDVNERNIALQRVIVRCSFTGAPVPFVSIDGGRLYDGNVFLDKVQCAVLDTTTDPTSFLNNLILSIFPRDMLKNSSVTGEKSRRSGAAAAKPALDSVRLNLIYSLMKEKTDNSADFAPSKINRCLAKKINNLNQKPRPSRKQYNSANVIRKENNDGDGGSDDGSSGDTGSDSSNNGELENGSDNRSDEDSDDESDDESANNRDE